MQMRYDPEVAPDPVEWLGTPEGNRLEAVRRHHERAKDEAEHPTLHATIHTIVETQLAERHPAATAALERLIADGLGRHEAVHAIGAVAMADLFEILKSKRPHDADAYAHSLGKLTAASWLAGDV